jgi:hypothetical protein
MTSFFIPMKTADGVDIVLNPNGMCNLGRDFYIIVWPNQTASDEFEVHTVPKVSIGPGGAVYYSRDGRKTSHGNLPNHFYTREGALRGIVKLLKKEEYVLGMRIREFERQLVPTFIAEGI